MLEAVTVPDSLTEARKNLAAGARLVAGGTIVMPLLNYGTDDFTRLVSLRRAGLSGISVKDGTVVLGAATPLADIEDEEALGFLRGALRTIASPTIRNMATVGGNLFAAQPYGDFAACLVALGATARIAGPDGIRAEPVETLVAAGTLSGEIVSEVSFGLPAAGTFRYRKAMRRALNSAAIVTVAAVVALDGGTVSACRIALGGVARHVVRAPSVERELAGKPLDREAVEAAARLAGNDIAPFDDAYASAWYRARVTPVHIRRALLDE